MKLLFSISYYHPYISGVSVYAKRLAEMLTPEHSCRVLCMKHQPNLADNEQISNVWVHRVKPTLFISKGVLAWRWFTAAWSEVKAAEIIFIHLPQFEGWITGLYAKLLKKKVICIYHCDVNLPSGNINRLIEFVLDLANYTSLGLANTIVAYTADYANSSRLLPKFHIKTKFILPPITVSPIDSKLKTQIANKIGQTDFVIGVASRLAAEKGIEYLLKAAFILNKEIPNFKIVIARPTSAIGENSYKERIETMARDLHDSVVFFDALPPEKMTAFYKNLDVLVLPSINSTESFGLVQVEAMMVGVPVIASDLPGVRVPVQMTGAGIIVPPRDSDKIAQAIAKIYHHPQDYRPTSKISSLFSLTNTQAAYERLILS